MEKKIQVHLLTPAEAFEYQTLLFQAYKPYLYNCDRENIVAVGTKDQIGMPCGLILAVTSTNEKGENNKEWVLCSIFVKEAQRRQGIGRSLWEGLRKELYKKDCREIKVQAVLREPNLEIVEAYLSAIGFPETIRIAKIFSFTSEGVKKSPFVTGTLANAFPLNENFSFLSFNELTESQMAELEGNEGNWYPQFVSPLLGKEHFNGKCTVFAVDSIKDKIAGWITAINVNDNKRILYRSFFTREEYRDTPVGFSIFTQAIKNHLNEFHERGGLSSIPTDNEKAMRFSTLFFREAYDHISYEIESNYQFLYLEDEPFVTAWKQANKKVYPIFTNVDLNNYMSLETVLFQSFGGKIPVMYMQDRNEFERLICEIFYKGEKHIIPLSMGALTIKGWKDIFGINHRAILLSDGYYSAVKPEDICLEPEDWKKKSLVLRRMHECVHYYTLRAFGFMNNALKMS